MRKIFITIIFFAFLPFYANQTVSAQTLPAGSPSAKAQARLASREENLKMRADNEIARRLSALNNLITKIGVFKKLSPDQKNQFSTHITTEIASLNELKTKIDTDTDATILRNDIQSIVISYRVFALYLPQINMLAYADRLLTTSDTMNTLAAKLQARIQEAQTAGKTVTALETSLTDMQNKISDAKTQAQSAINSVSPLTPSGYPGNKVTLQTARKMLTTSRQDLNAAFVDAKSIIQGLKNMKTTMASPTL